MSESKVNVEEALTGPLYVALERLPDGLLGKLEPYSEMYGVETEIGFVDGARSAQWLTCPEPPEGVTFRIPRLPQKFSELYVGGYHLQTRTFFPSSTHVPSSPRVESDGDESASATEPERNPLWSRILWSQMEQYLDVYQATVEKHAEAGDLVLQLPAIRAALAAIEEKDKLYRVLYEARAEEVCNLLNACFRMFTGEAVEAGSLPNANVAYTEYSAQSSELMQSWSKEDNKSTVNLECRRLQKLSGTYSQAEIAAFECRELSNLIFNALIPHARGRDFECKLHALAEFFDLPEVLLNSTMAGILYLARYIASLRQKLEFLDRKRTAYRVIQNAVTFDQKLPLWEEVKSRLGPPYEDETMQDSATGPFSSNAVWPRWGRFIVNRCWELEREGVTTRAEQARRIRPLLADRWHDELEQLGVSAADFGPKQLKRVLRFHRETGFNTGQ